MRTDSSILVSLVLLALLLPGCGTKETKAGDKSADAKPPPEVQTTKALTGNIEDRLRVTGTLTVPRAAEASVNSSVTGILDSMPVRLGDSVTRGQEIAHLSTLTLMGQIQQAEATIGQNRVQVQQAEVNAIQQRGQTRAAILEAESSLANARATLASDRATLTGNEATVSEAQQDYDREQTLFTDGLVASKDVLDAKLAVETARAQADAQKQTVDAQQQTVAGQQHAVEAAQTGTLSDVVKRQDIDVARQQLANAQGALKTYESQLDLCTLHAPLSGQVTAIGGAVGESVDSSAKIVTIANLDTLQLEISVPTESSSKVHVGQAVTFQADNLPGQSFGATIRTISKQVEATSNTVSAFATVANADHRLKDDETVTAQVIVRRKDSVVLVPSSALLSDPVTGDKTVAVVTPDGTLHITPVTLGISSQGKVEIVGGVAPGATVAVAGQYGVPDGTKVSVTSAP